MNINTVGDGDDDECQMKVVLPMLVQPLYESVRLALSCDSHHR